jgi:hypothetical protein
MELTKHQIEDLSNVRAVLATVCAKRDARELRDSDLGALDYAHKQLESVLAGHGSPTQVAAQKCYLCARDIQPGEAIAPTNTSTVTHQKCADRASRS